MAKQSEAPAKRNQRKPRIQKEAPNPSPPERDSPWKGRLASDVPQRRPEFLLHPWIPVSLLSMVVGVPCVGKSSFVASLISHATGGVGLDDVGKAPTGRVVFLPGYEEDLEVMTVPRLKAAGARLDRVKLLVGERISLVRDKERLAKACTEWRATLLVGDPIDSYIDEGFAENDGQAVRPLLEAAAWIARHAGVAVTFARHPGKDPENVMPGSRAWRAVPRSIVQLTSDGSVPPRYLMTHFKDSLGTGSSPRSYSLERKQGEAPKFVLGREIDRTAEDLSRAGSGLTGRYKLMHACRLIRWFFAADQTPTRVKLGEEARKQGLGEDTINDALRLLSVKSVPPSQRGDPWQLARLAGDWPEWLPEEGVSP